MPKTVDFENLKTAFNDLLSTECLNQDQKDGICIAMDILLTASGENNGYQFLHTMEDEYGKKIPVPGTRFSRKYL